MDEAPLVSIIITNYNYGRFVAAAIDSALQQRYQPLEVIVVDDGSTDQSRPVIAGYGARIVPVWKANGGQASCFNAGLAHSHGAIVLFLDADDVLLPDTVERVVRVFQSTPDLAKVQYRMAIVDIAGNPTGAIKPAMHLPMPNGDVRRQVLHAFDDLQWQSTSGNVFAASVLRRIFPVPEDVFPRTGADYYVSTLPLLFGKIVSLDIIGAHFRIHGSNNHHISRMDLDRTREIIRRICAMQAQIVRFADALGFDNYPRDGASVAGVRFLAQRMASVKLDRARHTIATDRPWTLCFRGIAAAMRRRDLALPLRLTYVLWFLVMAPAPRWLAYWLAEKFFFPERRRQFDKLFGAFRRMPKVSLPTK